LKIAMSRAVRSSGSKGFVSSSSSKFPGCAFSSLKIILPKGFLSGSFKRKRS